MTIIFLIVGINSGFTKNMVINTSFTPVKVSITPSVNSLNINIIMISLFKSHYSYLVIIFFFFTLISFFYTSKKFETSFTIFIIHKHLLQLIKLHRFIQTLTTTYKATSLYTYSIYLNKTF